MVSQSPRSFWEALCYVPAILGSRFQGTTVTLLFWSLCSHPKKMNIYHDDLPQAVGHRWLQQSMNFLHHDNSRNDTRSARNGDQDLLLGGQQGVAVRAYEVIAEVAYCEVYGHQKFPRTPVVYSLEAKLQPERERRSAFV